MYRIMKYIHKQNLRENGLQITTEAIKKITDFLDVTLNLNTGEHMPYI